MLALKVQSSDNILAQIGQHFAALEVLGKSELWPISQRHQNRPFFEILHRGDQGKIAQKVGRARGLFKHLGANPRDSIN